MAKRGRDHDGFSHSMTDLMAGVAVTFLLIAAIFMVQVARSDAKQKEEGRKASERLSEIKSTDAKAKDVLLQLRDILKANTDLKGLELLYDPDQDPFLLTIVLDRGRLRFAIGDCAILEETRAAMATSFGVIFGSVCEAAETNLIQSITLEGHTDNRPFFPGERICGIERSHRGCTNTPDEPACAAVGFENNVRLSAARAQNVFFEMRGLLGAQEKIARCLDTKFVVAGRGPVAPADGGDWKAVRDEAQNERNRRVVIKVRAIARSSIEVGGAQP